MAALVASIGVLDHAARRRGRPGEAYGSLVRTIVGQQLSTKAARTIYGRLAAVFGGKPPTPPELNLLDELPDEEISARITAVKGLGQWSADMFLMFHLRRPDVLPVGDLGIRRAVEQLYRLPGLPDADDLRTLAEPWRPWRTLACLYLWESLDAVPDPA
jgi:DNA-3-methyladenine glycosylase II